MLVTVYQNELMTGVPVAHGGVASLSKRLHALAGGLIILAAEA
jgi:hypothetical protein